MVIKEGLLGISMINADGINARPCFFLLDMFTSVVSSGKTEVYVKKEQPMPLGWAFDRTGQETRDAAEVNDVFKNKLCGGLLSLGGATENSGGHTSNYFCKGSGSGTSLQNKFRVSSCFIAVDYGIFGDKSGIEDRLSEYLQQLSGIRRKWRGRPESILMAKKSWKRDKSGWQMGLWSMPPLWPRFKSCARNWGLRSRNWTVSVTAIKSFNGCKNYGLSIRMSIDGLYGSGCLILYRIPKFMSQASVC
jgi:LDH2 family malate/lactate/ureidoglycolate dehydrogenase